MYSFLPHPNLSKTENFVLQVILLTLLSCYKLNRCYIKLSLVNILENVFVFIEILFKMLLFKGGVLIYAEHCICTNQTNIPFQNISRINIHCKEIKVPSLIVERLSGAFHLKFPTTRHQRAVSHHIDSHTTQTVTCHSGLKFPSSIALIAHTQLNTLITHILLNPIRHAHLRAIS